MEMLTISIRPNRNPLNSVGASPLDLIVSQSKSDGASPSELNRLTNKASNSELNKRIA